MSDGRVIATEILEKLTDDELRALATELRHDLHEAEAELTEISRKWFQDHIPTPISERSELAAEIAATRAELCAIERELADKHKRRMLDNDRRAREHAAKLCRWHFSDHMLAALTSLVEEQGLHRLVKQARVMVAKGWPMRGTQGGPTA